eukprot:261758-Rhodomonas_salina.2
MKKNKGLKGTSAASNGRVKLVQDPTGVEEWVVVLGNPPVMHPCRFVCALRNHRHGLDFPRHVCCEITDTYAAKSLTRVARLSRLQATRTEEEEEEEEEEGGQRAWEREEQKGK